MDPSLHLLSDLRLKITYCLFFFLVWIVANSYMSLGDIFMADTETAGEALRLANGYVLKGKPLVIEYARGAKAPSSSLSTDFKELPLIRSRRKRPTKVKTAT